MDLVNEPMTDQVESVEDSNHRERTCPFNEYQLLVLSLHGMDLFTESHVTSLRRILGWAENQPTRMLLEYVINCAVDLHGDDWPRVAIYINEQFCALIG